MKIKAIYRKNLKMSEEKVASQVSHAVKNLGFSSKDCDIIILKVSDKKFFELCGANECHIQYDNTLTEDKSNTPTVAVWVVESTLNNDVLEFAEWIVLNSIRIGKNTWSCKCYGYHDKYTTEELFEIFKREREYFDI